MSHIALFCKNAAFGRYAPSLCQDIQTHNRLAQDNQQCGGQEQPQDEHQRPAASENDTGKQPKWRFDEPAHPRVGEVHQRMQQS